MELTKHPNFRKKYVEPGVGPSFAYVQVRPLNIVYSPSLLFLRNCRHKLLDDFFSHHSLGGLICLFLLLLGAILNPLLD